MQVTIAGSGGWGTALPFCCMKTVTMSPFGRISKRRASSSPRPIRIHISPA